MFGGVNRHVLDGNYRLRPKVRGCNICGFHLKTLDLKQVVVEIQQKHGEVSTHSDLLPIYLPHWESQHIPEMLYVFEKTPSYYVTASYKSIRQGHIPYHLMHGSQLHKDSNSWYDNMIYNRYDKNDNYIHHIVTLHAYNTSKSYVQAVHAGIVLLLPRGK